MASKNGIHFAYADDSKRILRSPKHVAHSEPSEQSPEEREMNFTKNSICILWSIGFTSGRYRKSKIGRVMKFSVRTERWLSFGKQFSCVRKTTLFFNKICSGNRFILFPFLGKLSDSAVKFVNAIVTKLPEILTRGPERNSLLAFLNFKRALFSKSIVKRNLRPVSANEICGSHEFGAQKS